MNLKEVFDQLTYGELSQVAIGGGEAGAIVPAQYDRIVSHVNLGLAALYKRFNLKENELKIELIPGQTEYVLKSRFAVNGKGQEPVRYIKDTATMPFKDDLLKVERVYADSGYEFGINDLEDPYSLGTPTSIKIRVPQVIIDKGPDLHDDLKTDALKVVYRASHPKIVPDGVDLDPEVVELELPETHLQPLLLFVASRVHMPVGMTGEFNAGNNYLQQYEMVCRELENKGFQVDRDSQPDRITRNGWA